MILSVTMSKPTSQVMQNLGDNYTRVKIKLIASSMAFSRDKQNYMVEYYTQKQVFHSKMTESEVQQFIEKNIGLSFKNCVEKTDTQEITYLTNKKGKISVLKKDLKTNTKNIKTLQSQNRTKNYILPEGTPVPFLVHLGIMTAEGKVITSKFDKFKQINRFLEYIDDILNEITPLPDNSKPLHVVDFGCGKSYLTFAVYYYLAVVKKINCFVTGLDLKQEVIDYCNNLAIKFNFDNLKFSVGDIADYEQSTTPDIVITLHACDTATDYALNYAVKKGTKAILSVPCCQHEINNQLQRHSDTQFEPLLKYGLIKERFAALVTDALRGEYLEQHGYKVQILEFIDMSHTPKNLLIRAVKKQSAETSLQSEMEAKKLTNALALSHTLDKLLNYN